MMTREQAIERARLAKRHSASNLDLAEAEVARAQAALTAARAQRAKARACHEANLMEYLTLVEGATHA